MEELTPQQRGGINRAARLTPERRSEIASEAAAMRWAMQRVLGTYPKKRGNVERVEWHLRALSRLMGKAVLEQDFKEARACVQAMLGFERLKMWVEMNAGKPGGAALETTGVEQETEKRLAEAKARRNKALGLEEEAEIVVEPTKPD
jgi:hypothetical protein